MHSNRPKRPSARSVGTGALVVLVVASVGCRQIFGLEEPEESASSAASSSSGDASSSSGATSSSSSASSSSSSSSSGGGDPCLAQPKEEAVLASIDPPGVSLGCEKDYLLLQDATVLPGATLTIAPGTTIRANANARLIIDRGAKLMAEGTPDRPIVFTKNESTSWGGIEMRGRAPGSGFVCAADVFAFESPGVPMDSSGSLRYVRLDHAGSQETDCTGALMLIGVGSGTVLEHLDIPASGSDGVSIAGGNPQLRHVVITDTVDDGIDVESGATVKLQFIVYRGLSDAGPCPNGAHCPDAVDADDANTQVEVRNATLCGHQTSRALHEGVLVGTGANVILRRSIIVGHEAALDVEDPGTATLETSVLANDHDIGPTGEAMDSFDEEQFTAGAFLNTLGGSPIQCFGSVALLPSTPVGNFGPPLGSSGFFVEAPYTGALTAGDDWISSWIVVPP